ncbi:AraC family transcriptional regulator [Carboxylicivirga sp. M1479]|uniref:helix-turn-helix domain-containing protein n=1 Tax=Carboxylicivirga sp. M1479 TaxID=2594476 RepID=UPI0011788FEA|nr:AraC family transcriptional regulator [Carboxylicivirga sp. M1479]TRX71175.1 helix-turn-helix transcriptional regulator [Carboxylicivirga sp. M1479]
MLQFKITKTESQLNELATQLGATIEDNIMPIPKQIGNGQISRNMLTKGIILQDGEFNLFQDFTINRKIEEDESMHHFSLIYVFNQLNYIYTEDEAAESGIQNYLLFFNKHYSYSNIVPAYTRFKQIQLFVSVEKLLSLCSYYALPNEINKHLQTNEQWCYKFPFTAEVQKVLHQLSTYETENAFTKGYMINKSEELIVLALEQVFKEQSNKSDKNSFIHQDDLNTLYEAEKMLLESTDEIIKISELSDKLSIGIRKLQRLFKAYHGVDMTSYRKQIRMEQARHMILEQRLSITDVCFKMGYTSNSHFSKIFKDQFGYSPSNLLNK